MERIEAVFFAGQLREAREIALRDSEAFDGIVHALERLGTHLNGRILDLGRYQPSVEILARSSALAFEIPSACPFFHTPFDQLYDLVRIARNDALHQGAFARRLTEHAVRLSLVLEDALRRGIEMPTVGDFMVRNPVCAELWHPISFIRQTLLTNSFSFLPVRRNERWHLISNLEIATYLGSGSTEHARRQLLATKLEASPIDMSEARCCHEGMELSEALTQFAGDPSPLLVRHSESDQSAIVGILTPFDLL
jgi:hypothetical protein